MAELTKINREGRSAGLDIVRVFAILFVIGGHFFLHTDLNREVFGGFSMFLQAMAQTLFLINVPLFLILTGYLNLNKRINRSYYKGAIAVLLSYLFISVVTVIFREYYAGEHMSVVRWALEITNFSAISYGWYVEMWIGLFLFTPFLNILWHNINSQRHRQVLLLTLFALTALPDFFNRYGVSLVPGYWELLYPVTFFFIGAYIREYRPCPSRLKLIMAIVALCMINPVFNILFVHGRSLIHLAGDGNGIVGMPLATAFFLLFYQVNLKSDASKMILSKISVYSLDMYLCSYMFDVFYYRYFKAHFFETQSQFGMWFFVIVPLVFVSSFIFAWGKSGLFRLVHLPTK